MGRKKGFFFYFSFRVRLTVVEERGDAEDEDRCKYHVLAQLAQDCTCTGCLTLYCFSIYATITQNQLSDFDMYRETKSIFMND